MDSATKHLLHTLYTNPRDSSALAEVRSHFLKQKQFPALAKVLEWWSAKAANTRQAAEALFEAAELLDRGKPDPTRVIALLEKSLEYDPAFNSASIKLEALYRTQGEDDKAAQLLERRIERISLIEALDDVFSSQDENRISFSSKPSDRLYEASNNPRIQRSSGSSAPDDRFTPAVAASGRDQNLQVPATPRVPDFGMPSTESRAKAFDPFDDADLEGHGFDDQPTSNRRVPRSGMPLGSEVGASFGGELETQTVASSRTSRPPAGMVAEHIVRAVSTQALQTLADDVEDDDDEDRFYRSYSERSPDNGGSTARDYDFNGPGRDGARGLDPQTEFYPEDDDSDPWADQQRDEDDEEAVSAHPEAETAYRVIAREPTLDPADIDSAQPTIEVDVMWGHDNVLHVEHLSPPRAFSVGDDKETDFLIGRETLGTDRLPVLIESESGIAVVVPPGATGEVVINDQVSTFQTLFDNGLLQPCRELTGAYQFLLPPKSSVYIGYCGFVFIVRAGVGAKSVGKERAKRFRLTDQTWWNLLVAGFVFLMLLCFAIRPPESPMLSLDAMNADARLAEYLIEPPEFEEEEIPEWLQEEVEEEENDEEQEEQEEAESKPDESTKTNIRRRRSSGPSNGQRASRLLSALASTAPSGGQSLKKVVAKLGSAGGGSPGGSFSLSNALAGLDGIGGINLGGSGSGRGTGIGFGSAGGEAAAKGVGKLGGRGGRGSKSVRGKVRALSLGSRVSGSLTQGQVLQVINRHMAKIQQCYERGLTRKPTLAGQVKFDWTVTSNGSVSSLRQASSTLGDTTVTSCIAKTISGMRFPKPKGGAVKITFPFIFRRAQ